MKTRILFLIAIFAILTTAVLVHAQQNATPAKHRVVFQMNMPSDSWNQLLGNVGNIQKAFGAEGVRWASHSANADRGTRERSLGPTRSG